MASLRVAAQSFTYIAVYSACFPSSLSFLYSCSCCCCMSERLVISENPPMCACQRVVVSEYRGQTYHHPPKSIPPPLPHLHTRILVTPSLLIMVGVLIWQRRFCRMHHLPNKFFLDKVSKIFSNLSMYQDCVEPQNISGVKTARNPQKTGQLWFCILSQTENQMIKFHSDSRHCCFCFYVPNNLHCYKDTWCIVQLPCPNTKRDQR